MGKALSLPWPEFAEEEAIGELLKSSAKFRLFYQESRERVGLVRWVRDSDMPKGIRCRVTIGEFSGQKIRVVRLRQVPALVEDALRIAHELEHLVLSSEGFPSVGSGLRQYENLASSLCSMTHDPIVDSRLQSYGFDLHEDYKVELENTLSQLKRQSRPPADHSKRMMWMFNYIGIILEWELLSTDRPMRDFQKWFGRKFPEIMYKARELLRMIRRIGYDTPGKQSRLYSEIIRHCKLGDRLIIGYPGLDENCQVDMEAEGDIPHPPSSVPPTNTASERAAI